MDQKLRVRFSRELLALLSATKRRGGVNNISFLLLICLITVNWTRRRKAAELITVLISCQDLLRP